jgi:hypothetical protein
MPNAQEHINQITNKERVFYLNISDRGLSGVMDLGEFKNLKSLTSSNNKSEVDFAFLFTNFPNLKTINLSNNPLAGRSLERLDRQQFSRFVQLIETGKIKISSLKGTFLVDLLKYTERLVTSSQSRQISSTDYFCSEPSGPKTSSFFSLIGLTFLPLFLWLVFSCLIRHKENKKQSKAF